MSLTHVFETAVLVFGISIVLGLMLGAVIRAGSDEPEERWKL
jgi:hypothetical protein